MNKKYTMNLITGSQAPAWEPSVRGSSFASCEAGASRNAFPSWSLGTSFYQEYNLRMITITAGSQAPAWEPSVRSSSFASCEAGASRNAFPSWSLGTSLYLLLGMLFLLLLSGCSHISAEKSQTFDKSAKWALLPMENLAETPRAGERAESILVTSLRKKGVQDLAIYPQEENTKLSLLLNDGKRIKAAKDWAKGQGVRYAFGGSVQEWRYKTGLDGEPAVGITLQVIDLNSDEVVWSGSASRTGWGYENLSGTAAKVINRLVNKVALR